MFIAVASVHIQYEARKISCFLDMTGILLIMVVAPKVNVIILIGTIEFVTK